MNGSDNMDIVSYSKGLNETIVHLSHNNTFHNEGSEPCELFGFVWLGIITGIVCMLGCVGNILCLIVLHRSRRFTVTFLLLKAPASTLYEEKYGGDRNVFTGERMVGGLAIFALHMLFMLISNCNN